MKNRKARDARTSRDREIDRELVGMAERGATSGTMKMLRALLTIVHYSTAAKKKINK